MIAAVVGWLAMAAFIVLAAYALDRHSEWTRLARRSAERSVVGERLKKRPSYDPGNAVGHAQEEIAAELAEEIPAWCREPYLARAREEIAAEREDEADMQDDVELRVKRRRRLIRARKVER